MKSILFAGLSLLTLLANLLTPATARTVQYSFVDPGYTQEIYTGPLAGGPGMAWTTSNNLLSRNGSTILEYSPTQNTVYQGTNLHGVILSHPLSGLDPGGYGLTNGLDGYIYANSPSGLQRFNPNNWAAPVQNLAGTSGGLYGIATLPDGRIVYNDSVFGASKIYVYDPVATTNTLIYSSSTQLDGIVTGPTGNIALADQLYSKIVIITNTGSVLNTINTAHYPDGLAFAETASSSTLYSNNNDGTITRYVLAPGYTGTPTVTDIATGSGAYGDLAAVGPDCAFYVSQAENGNYHGATAGVGTNWDNLVTTNEKSIIRIGSGIRLPDGTTVCHFYSPIVGGVVAPEPASLTLLGLGSLLLLSRRRRA